MIGTPVGLPRQRISSGMHCAEMPAGTLARICMNGWRHVLLVVLLRWLGASSPASANAQVVSASVGTGSTAHPDLPSPTSASWTIAAPPIRGFSLQYGRRWLRDEVVQPGTTCDAYWPIGANCRDEGIASRFRVYSH